MADRDNRFSLFGFEIKRKKSEKEVRKSFVPPTDDDGTSHVISASGFYGQYVDLDPTLSGKSENDHIMKYRDIAQQAECDSAIQDIVNESIVNDDDSSGVDLILEDADVPDKIKEIIQEEFDNVLKLLDFNWKGSEIFRRWYIDGRLYYHKIVDFNNKKKGIIELRYIDPLRIKKIREVKEETDPKTKIKFVKEVKEYYLYQNRPNSYTGVSNTTQGLRILKDAIAFVPSGVTDVTNKQTLSYLHKALKPVNQLRMMEDSLVIYRLTRSPERRVFYIDVGNLPKSKAEEYMKNIIAKYRNKMVYDANTGELKDDRKHMSMLEDFWLPRKEGGRGTQVETLPGGENLGQIEDIIYFQKKLYRSLNVPLSRLEQETSFNIGRTNEITREELKFQKFIDKLRRKFVTLFFDLLKTQLILKGIMSNSEWEDISQKISFRFAKDVNFSELKDAELLTDRIRLLNDLDQFVGRYYSIEWVRKNVLKQTDEDIEKINNQIEKEKRTGEIDNDEDLGE